MSDRILNYQASKNSKVKSKKEGLQINGLLIFEF